MDSGWRWIDEDYAFQNAIVREKGPFGATAIRLT
jgi:hypothetical protein